MRNTLWQKSKLPKDFPPVLKSIVSCQSLARRLKSWPDSIIEDGAAIGTQAETSGAKAQDLSEALSARLKSSPDSCPRLHGAFHQAATVCPFKTHFSPQARKGRRIFSSALAAFFVCMPSAIGAPTHKTHLVGLSAAKKVPYSKAGDPAGAAAGEDTLRIRALVVDGQIKEWTTGDAHDVTDRSFVVRRVIKINDSLPSDDTAPGGSSSAQAPTGRSGPPASHWVWQRGPWLLVDRVSGHVAALKLPDYDPGVSQVVWFRDYGAYCGITVAGKSVYAVVAQVAARRPALSKKIAAFTAEDHQDPVCGATDWQREPLKVTFHPTGQEAVGFDLAPGSAVLVEDSADEAEAPAK
jgi:hypothetical protein